MKYVRKLLVLIGIIILSGCASNNTADTINMEGDVATIDGTFALLGAMFGSAANIKLTSMDGKNFYRPMAVTKTNSGMHKITVRINNGEFITDGLIEVHMERGHQYKLEAKSKNMIFIVSLYDITNSKKILVKTYNIDKM